MKQEVNRRIYEKRPKRRTYGKWIVAAASVTACFVALVLIFPAGLNERAPSPAGIQNQTPEPSDNLPTPSPETPPIAEERIPLAYANPADDLGDYPVEVNRVEASRIPKDSLIVKRVMTVDGLEGNYLIYAKKEGQTRLYAGMEILNDGPGSEPADEIYEIGPIGELTYLNDVEITKSNLFGQFGLRFYGVCGANCVINNWIHFEEAVPGVPISEFRLNTHAQEVDLDEDGVPEVIATESSTIGKVQIYKKFADRIKFVDLNAALKAEHPYSVISDANQRTFSAIFPDRKLSYQYGKGEDVLILVDDSLMEKNQSPLIIGGIYDGNDTVRLQVDGTAHDANWFKDPLTDYGFYLPTDIQAVKLEDGYEYESTVGGGIIQLREADATTLPTLRKEKDLAGYSDYAGSEYWGDKKNIRYDYFLYEYDSDHKIYIAIRYSTDYVGKIRPLMLAVVANIRFAPEQA